MWNYDLRFSHKVTDLDDNLLNIQCFGKGLISDEKMIDNYAHFTPNVNLWSFVIFEYTSDLSSL